MDHSQKTCSKESNSMAVEKASVLQFPFMKTITFIPHNKKHSSKQGVSITYALEKNFLAAFTFGGLY